MTALQLSPGRAWQGLVSVFLALLAFCLPFSTAGVAISLGALLILAVLRAPLLWRAQPWKEPVMAAGLLLFAYIAVHSLWASGLTGATARAVNRYHELLFAPMLLVLLREVPQRRLFFRALMAGAVMLAVVHWTAGFHPRLAAFIEVRRISAGFALAVCAFLLLAQARESARPWPARALAAFLAATVLFTIQGRTGLVVLLVLAACAAWLHAPGRWRWAAALAAPLLAIALALGFGAVNGRLQESVAGSQAVGPQGPVTSTGIRIELLRLAGDLARQHALRGAGYGNYPVVHEQAAIARYGGDPATASYLQAEWVRATNPHNEFAMQLVGGGVVALGLFVAWLALALRRAAASPAPVGAMLAGTTLAFAAGCMLNAMLMDFVEGHFYMGLLAWLVAQGRAPARDRVDRILVVATRQIGDVLLTTPLIRAARQRWPQARIEVLGLQGTLGMLAGNTDVDCLLETPPRLGLRGLRTWVPRLWRRYDLALVADGGDRAHLLGWLAAPRRAGIVPEGGGSNWWKRGLLDHAVTAAGDRGEVHTVVEKLSLLTPWLEAGSPPGPLPVVPPRGKPLPPDVAAQLRPGAVLVHAPSMWPYKQWPLAHFRALVQALLAQGRQVVLTGSGSPRDQECVAALRDLAAPPRLLDLSGRLDFGQLVTLFDGAALYIGPDTSVSHLAAAAGVPVIVIFGPTNPMRWGPWPADAAQRAPFIKVAPVQQAGNVTLLQSGLSCVPCGRAGCEDHRGSRSDCLADIGPERVLEQALKVLARDDQRSACAG